MSSSRTTIEGTLLNFLSALVGAPFLAKAQQRVGEARYEDALNALRSLGRVLGCGIASEKMPLRANIIAFQSGYWLGDVEIMKWAASISVEQANAASSRKDGSKERYISAYLYGMCEFSAGRFAAESEFFLALAAKAAKSRFDYRPEEVPEKLRKEMPLGAK